MAAAALASAAGLTTAVPTAAHAANSCWSGPNVTNWQGITFQSKTCPTWTGVNVYEARGENAQSQLVYTGYLNAANNWVVCQAVGDPNPSLGGGTNNIWLYTQGDTTKSLPERKAWGWIPATAVSYGANNAAVPGVPWCSTYPGYTP